MSTIVILGAGLMGSAFSMPLADNGHTIRLVGTHLDGDIIEELHESGVHPRLKTRLAAGVTPFTYDRLGEALVGADLVVVGVNSFGVQWAGEMLGPLLPAGMPLLFLTKGLYGDGERLHLLPERLRSFLPPERRADVKLAAVGGPSIAGELAARRDTSVVVTGGDPAMLPWLAGLMQTRYYHVWPNADMVGVETCVAMKNLYALAVGLVGGLLEREGVHANGSLMFNQAAALFAQGLWEMGAMVDFMGGQRKSVFTLPGAGDLYVTSMGGRNARLGRFVGQGMPYSEAKRRHMPDDTIEGAQLLLAIGPTVEHLFAQETLRATTLPLMRHMIDVICHDRPVDFPWDAFFAE